MECSNSSRKITRVISPQCHNGKATVSLTVVYHDNPFNKAGETSDTLSVCQDCAKLITADAERYGYTVREEIRA